MKERERTCALILAAGYSSRMGAFKPLLPLGKATVLEEAIARLQQAGIQQIKVVVGYQAETITPVLRRLGVGWVVNDQHDRGMLSSVLAGVRGLDPEVEAFFLLPVDIPLVKPRTIATLLSAYHNSGGRLVYPCFRGVRGHPPLLATACLSEELTNDYPGGLCAFLSRYEHSALDVEVVDQAILMDCDTPADYEKLQAYACREAIPTEQECEALWVQYHVPEPVVAHSRMVAQVARLLAVLLKRSGLNLDLEVIVAAGLLHDLAKGQPEHALEAGRILSEMGCPLVAGVVSSHMDIVYHRGSVDEAALVYLADKLVNGDQVVPFEERFKRGMKKFRESPEILEAVRVRWNHAKLIREDVEAALGQPIEQILHRFERNIRAVSVGGKRDIYLIRHGAVPLEGGGKRFLGQLDLSLSREGIAQVQRLRDELRGLPISAICCSDLRRSVDTAAILTAALPGDPIAVQRPEMREINLGEWEGLTFDEVKEEYPEEFQRRGRDLVHYRPPGGESFLDCTKRVIPAFFNLLQATRGNILIVGHAGVNRIILCQVLGLSLANLFEIEQDHACLNLIHYEDGTFTVNLLNARRV
jgi:molybdenum cofactor cytidylyltransferase